MSFINAFVNAIPIARKIGNKVVLKNQRNPDTIVYENLNPDVLALYVSRYGEKALEDIFNREKERMVRFMYGGKNGS